MQWTSDPPREWQATLGPGWSLDVHRHPVDPVWQWSATFKAAGGGVYAEMGGTAETPDEAKHAAEEASECIALALREFVHHTKKKSDLSGPPPF